MKQHLGRIQVLRFAAAAMVLFGHAQLKLNEVAGLDLSSYTPPKNTAFFVGGVDIFFVISGFIMYTISRRDFGRPGAAPRFFLRRLARIAPSYWFFTTAMIAAMLLFGAHVAHNDLNAWNAVASYLFIPAPNAYGDYYPVLILGWTLNFEMLFYVIFACALGFTPRAGVVAVFALVGILAAAGVAAPPAGGPFAFWCNPIVIEFLFGILLAQAYAAGVRWPAAAGAGAAALGFVLLYLGSAMSPANPFWVARPLAMGLPALLICAAAALTPEPAQPGAARRLLVLAGDASYALYLLHPFALVATAMLWPHTGVRDPWLFIAVRVLVSIALAVLFHLALEKPVTQALNRWMGRRSFMLPKLDAGIS